MNTDATLRWALTVAVTAAVLAYHLIGSLYSPPSSLDTAFSLSRLVVSVLVALTTITYGPIVRLLLRDKYIGGRYEAHSRPYRGSTPGPYIHRDKFTIKQTLLGISVHGASYLIDGSNALYSRWEGSAFRIVDRTIFVGLELRMDSIEYGILTLTLEEDDSVSGLYFSGGQGKMKAFEIQGWRTPKGSKKLKSYGAGGRQDATAQPEA